MAPGKLSGLPTDIPTVRSTRGACIDSGCFHHPLCQRRARNVRTRQEIRAAMGLNMPSLHTNLIDHHYGVVASLAKVCAATWATPCCCGKSDLKHAIHLPDSMRYNIWGLYVDTHYIQRYCCSQEKKLRRTAPICGPAWSPGQPAPTSQIQGAKPSRLLFLLRRNLMAMINLKEAASRFDFEKVTPKANDWVQATVDYKGRGTAELGYPKATVAGPSARR